MHILVCRIEIDCALSGVVYALDGAAEIEIERDRAKTCQTCRLTVPRNARWGGAEECPVRRGDRIRVWLGYNDELRAAFAGYVARVGAGSPAVIECEDEMFRHRGRAAVKKFLRRANIRDMLSAQGLEADVFKEQTIGDYSVTQDTVGHLLKDLSQNGFRFFYTLGDDFTPHLKAGLLFNPMGGREISAVEGENIADRESLTVVRAGERLVKVKAISMLPGGKRINVEVGDSEGDMRTLNKIGLGEKELRAEAEAYLESLRREGLEGTVTLFGGVLADLEDRVRVRLLDGTGGLYTVQKNYIKWGSGGFRQEVELGIRIGD